MAKKILTIPCADQDAEQHWWWKCKLAQPLWETVWQFLGKLNTHLPHDPEILLPAIYPREVKIHVHSKTCPQMVIATLLITAKKWNQPKCPSMVEWINKLWYGDTMEYNLALKRNELLK